MNDLARITFVIPAQPLRRRGGTCFFMQQIAFLLSLKFGGRKTCVLDKKKGTTIRNRLGAEHFNN